MLTESLSLHRDTLDRIRAAGTWTRRGKEPPDTVVGYSRPMDPSSSTICTLCSVQLHTPLGAVERRSKRRRVQTREARSSGASESSGQWYERKHAGPLKDLRCKEVAGCTRPKRRQQAKTTCCASSKQTAQWSHTVVIPCNTQSRADTQATATAINQSHSSDVIDVTK